MFACDLRGKIKMGLSFVFSLVAISNEQGRSMLRCHMLELKDGVV